MITWANLTAVGKESIKLTWTVFNWSFILLLKEGWNPNIGGIRIQNMKYITKCYKAICSMLQRFSFFISYLTLWTILILNNLVLMPSKSILIKYNWLQDSTQPRSHFFLHKIGHQSGVHFELKKRNQDHFLEKVWCKHVKT